MSQASLTQFSCVVIHLRNKIYLVFPLYIMRTLFNRTYSISPMFGLFNILSQQLYFMAIILSIYARDSVAMNHYFYWINMKDFLLLQINNYTLMSYSYIISHPVQTYIALFFLFAQTNIF